MTSTRPDLRALALCLALTAWPATADTREACDAWGLLDPANIETVGGRIARVDSIPCVRGGREVSLVLMTDTGDAVPVAVAPRWVVKREALRLRRGTRIEVTGWRIVRAKPALLAAEIRVDDRLVVLRDRHGTAAWSRQTGESP